MFFVCWKARVGTLPNRCSLTRTQAVCYLFKGIFFSPQKQKQYLEGGASWVIWHKPQTMQLCGDMAHHVWSITVPLPTAALCPFSRASERKTPWEERSRGWRFPNHGFFVREGRDVISFTSWFFHLFKEFSMQDQETGTAKRTSWNGAGCLQRDQRGVGGSSPSSCSLVNCSMQWDHQSLQ